MSKLLPILFTTEMVQALLDGRKSQTRRLSKLDTINQAPREWYLKKIDNDDFETVATFVHKTTGQIRKVVCPYGVPGDVLYVRESFSVLPTPAGPSYFYQASHPSSSLDAHKWKPGIHLPKEASRLYLTVEAIDCEPLQDIGGQDAISEGIEPELEGWKDYGSPSSYIKADYPETSFKTLFIKVHGGYIKGQEKWDHNPWVWVVKFRYNLKMILQHSRG